MATSAGGSSVSAVGFVAACDLRRRVRSAVLLAVLVGVVGAVVLSTAAGARRSSRSLARFTAVSRTSDMTFLPAFAYSPTAAQMAAARAVPDVVAVSELRFYAVGSPQLPKSEGLPAAVGPSEGTVVDRTRVVAGRLAHGIDEVDVDAPLAAALHLHLGSPIALGSYTPKQVLTAQSGPPPTPAGPSLTIHVVGLVLRPEDIGVNAGEAASVGQIQLTAAFDRAYVNRIGNFGALLNVRTKYGAADRTRVTAAFTRIFAKSGGISAQSGTGFAAQGAQDAIDVISLALWILAGVIALAGTVAIAIVLGRDLGQAGADQPTLRALGLTRAQRMLVSAPRAAIVIAGGALLAVIGAIALSPIFPVGIARLADPDVGLHLDWTVVAIGFGAIIAIVAAITLTALASATDSARFAGGVPRSARRASAFDVAARASAPVAMTSGLGMAFEPGRGARAVPVRSAALGSVLGALALALVLVFATSLDRLVTTPTRFGWNWSFQASDADFNGSAAGCGRQPLGLDRVPGVGAITAVCNDAMQADGRPETGWAFTKIRGAIPPGIVAGRAPESATEVALGARTLSALHTRIGATVSARGAGRAHTYRVVGQAVFADLGDGTPLADGLLFTPAGLAPVFDSNNASNRHLVADVSPGGSLTAVLRTVAKDPALGKPSASMLPVEIGRVHDVGWLPTTVAVLVGLLALIAVGHALFSAARRRRRDLAVLKTLGFTHAQVRAVIAWQATALAVIGIVVGLPFGMILGRLLWRAVATSVGVATTPVMPVVALAAATAAMLALVNLVALAPARRAARIVTATALRTE